MSTTTLLHGATDWRAPAMTLFRKVQTGWAIFLLATRKAEMANELYYLSDAELERRGLKREQIAEIVAGVAA